MQNVLSAVIKIGAMQAWDANRAAMKQRLDELDAFMHGHEDGVTEYDEGLVRQLIERITVYDDHLTFEFKIGLETEVQA